MTERFTAWVAQTAMENDLRLSMALLALFIVVTWEALQLWPARLQAVGRRAFIVVGGLSYAVLFAVGLYTLGRFLYLGR